VGVIGGDPQGRVEHVHQLRIGMRRLSTALRSFQGWVPPPPTELVEGLRRLFAALGMARDNDVLNSGVLAELAKAGAPPLALTAAAAGPDPAELVGGAPTQQLLLAWISWRASLVQEHNGTVTEAPTLQRQAERRLRRWHRRIVAEGRAFDRLDEAELHALRKRIKRQRYAVEFFAPLLRRRAVERYLQALTEVQDRMGELADLFVARARYQPLAADAAAWFAFGWLAARIADVRALAQPGLRQLASMDPPTS
jgi:CHAD domain-containing protein